LGDIWEEFGSYLRGIREDFSGEIPGRIRENPPEFLLNNSQIPPKYPPSNPKHLQNSLFIDPGVLS
jgi:hypothetical protein